MRSDIKYKCRIYTYDEDHDGWKDMVTGLACCQFYDTTNEHN